MTTMANTEDSELIAIMAICAAPKLTSSPCVYTRVCVCFGPCCSDSYQAQADDDSLPRTKSSKVKKVGMWIWREGESMSSVECDSSPHAMLAMLAMHHWSHIHAATLAQKQRSRTKKKVGGKQPMLTALTVERKEAHNTAGAKKTNLTRSLMKSFLP